jgi:hypothetical protein
LGESFMRLDASTSGELLQQDVPVESGGVSWRSPPFACV